MPSRKRGFEEMEADEPDQEPSLLDKVRNMWEFASLMQYIFFFGKAVKIDDDLDIEELEAECLKPTHSDRLSQIGLALLKFVSSHKGLTPEIFDEYTRRQYVAKAPQRNPFGVDEEPKKFAEFDVSTKIRVLQQLSTWTLNNPDRIRERLDVRDVDQTQWRIEPAGWDAQDRSYFLLDDNRLYRRTDPPIPEPPKQKPKAKAKRGKGARASKRRKVSGAAIESSEEMEETAPATEVAETNDEGFGGMKWECLAVTLEDYNAFLQTIRRSRDPNEKVLFSTITEKVLPVLEQQVEERQRKEARRLRELENLQKLATAKRSSRIADKLEKQKELDEAAAAERKKLAEIAMAKKEQEKMQNGVESRESRVMTREQRVKEREVKRILHEQELARLEEASKKVETNEARMSERKIREEMQRRQRELEKLAQEEDWEFDCAVCGVHGKNMDDGSHSIACEKCNVWQHSACHGIKKEEAEQDDFHFICADCKRRARKANEPKIPPLKFHMGPSASPKDGEAEASRAPTRPVPAHAPRQLDGVHINVQARTAMSPPPKTPNIVMMNGPSLSPHGQSPGPPPGIQGLGVSYRPPLLDMHGHPTATPARPLSSGFDIPTLVSNSATLSPLQYWQHQNGYMSGQPNPSHQNNGLHNQAIAFTPQAPTYHPPHNPYMNTIHQHRPPSAQSAHGFQSPVKHQHPASSPPPPTNGHASHSPFPPASSPNASFPPPPSQPAQHPPIKQASSPPRTYQAPAGYTLLGSTPGYSPTKSPPRPASGHGVSGTPVVPPATTLSPSTDRRQQRLSLEPPAKKMMTPERPQANGYGNPF